MPKINLQHDENITEYKTQTFQDAQINECYPFLNHTGF
jgi:hypothetical protein